MPWGRRVTWGTKKRLETSRIVNQPGEQLEDPPQTCEDGF